MHEYAFWFHFSAVLHIKSTLQLYLCRSPCPVQASECHPTYTYYVLEFLKVEVWIHHGARAEPLIICIFDMILLHVPYDDQK